MQMKKNKALLLGGTVLFSVTGSVEEANSAEIQNEINIINDEKPVVTTNVEKNKAPRIYEGETMPVTVAKALGKVGVPYVRNNNQKQSGLTDNHEDEKGRYSFNEDKTKIRANQGHKINVDVELEEKEPPKKINLKDAFDKNGNFIK